MLSSWEEAIQARSRGRRGRSGPQADRLKDTDDRIVGEMSDLERLVAIEDIKQLKSRRDRAVDMKDWEMLEALHAPDHHSYVEGFPPWTTAAEMIRNIRASLEEVVSVHQCHTPDITFESPTRARGVWAMEDFLTWQQDGREHWLRGYGFYEEIYEKRAGRWIYVWRRLTRLKVNISEGGVLPATRRS
jgi:hypothetical protein